MKPTLLDNGGGRLGVDRRQFSYFSYTFLRAGLLRKAEAGLIGG